MNSRQYKGEVKCSKIDFLKFLKLLLPSSCINSKLQSVRTGQIANLNYPNLFWMVNDHSSNGNNERHTF